MSGRYIRTFTKIICLFGIVCIEQVVKYVLMCIFLTGSLPAVVPVRAFVTTIETTASGKAFVPISCLCESESQLHKTPTGPATQDLDTTKIYSSTSSPMSSSSSGDFHQRQPLLESKSNGGWYDDTRAEEIHTKVSVINN